jgi:hypothetical protein
MEKSHSGTETAGLRAVRRNRRSRVSDVKPWRVSGSHRQRADGLADPPVAAPTRREEALLSEYCVGSRLNERLIGQRQPSDVADLMASRARDGFRVCLQR